MKLFELTTGDDGFDDLIEAGSEESAIKQVLQKHGIEKMPPHWELELIGEEES